jgi:GNAT superfamily N-acetyltransferase
VLEGPVAGTTAVGTAAVLEGRAAGARGAVPADAGRLAELYEAAVAELAPMRGGRILVGLRARSTPVQSFLDQFDDPTRLLVVGLLGHQVVGYGSCHTYEVAVPGAPRAGTSSSSAPGPVPERVGAIDELYVSPEARRHGVGRSVAAVVLEWCRAQGCTGVDASALPGSRAVKSFFESERFTARVLVMHRRLS